MILRAFRLVSLILLVVTLAAFGTIAYSLFQIATEIQANPQSFQPEFSLRVIRGTPTLVAQLQLPNPGAYALQLSLAGELRIGDILVGQQRPERVTIAPGERGTVRLQIPLNLGRLTQDPAVLQRLLVEGERVRADLELQGALVPFVGLEARFNISQPLPGLLSEVTVTPLSVRTVNRTHVELLVRVQGQASLIPFPPLRLEGILRRTPVHPAPGTYGVGATAVTLAPGEALTVDLRLVMRGDALVSGTYELELRVRMDGIIGTRRVTFPLVVVQG